jgi:hypothetical protein
MSDLPMTIPTEEHKEWQYGELMVCLPNDWKLDDESLKNEEYYHLFFSYCSFGRHHPINSKNGQGWQSRSQRKVDP